MYVLEQTGSAAVFASLLAVAMLPTILLSPFGGILADRRSIMVGLDLLSGCAVLLAVAVCFFLTAGLECFIRLDRPSPSASFCGTTSSTACAF